MSWTLLIGLVLALAIAVVALFHRRAELSALARTLGERERAIERGSHKARLQYPHVDLGRCLGCGSCVRACPEEGVLEMIHGQALVVHGARCVGHGLCAQECPVDAISVTLGDIESRDDIPALNESFEVPSRPGLFLAGELTGYALVRTAIAHGTAVADEVGRRVLPARVEEEATGEDLLDLCIVGAGPAGLACALQAKARGLRSVVLEQEQLGGTVAKYPRRKLVMTQPVELPLHGRLNRTTYTKEELLELWQQVIAENDLPVWSSVVAKAIEGGDGEPYRVETSAGTVCARNVCLALGRRGTPRKLGVPGEELAKVSYGLIDASSYTGRRVLVVGGGDSAVEAALALAEQPGNEVTLSYRKAAFTRLKARNEAHILEAVANGRVHVAYRTQVSRIDPESVELAQHDGEDCLALTLDNDDVFVLAGGVPPFELLHRAGVSFDPADRPRSDHDEGSAGLRRSLVAALIFSLAALAWTLWFSSYYGLPLSERRTAPLHDFLRPSKGAGLGFGVAAAGLIAVNLAYLLRRSPRIPLALGSLRAWMSAHVVTGVLALALALLHAAMAPRATVGGHAFLALGVLVVTGAIGRWFYAFVPRAANGRELALEEIRGRLAALSAEWERGNRDLGERTRARLTGIVAEGARERSFARRVLLLLESRGQLRALLAELRAEAESEGVPPEQVAALASLARRAHRAAFMASHFEDLRALLGSWRYLHRWVALLMVLLVAAHIVTALRYGGVLD